jgi:hypothetical protein
MSRRLVWWTYVGRDKGETLCICCRKVKINSFEYHRGHVIARSRGGSNNVENLRPICGGCNTDMRTQDMRFFIQTIREFDEEDRHMFENLLPPMVEETKPKPKPKTVKKKETIRTQREKYTVIKEEVCVWCETFSAVDAFECHVDGVLCKKCSEVIYMDMEHLDECMRHGCETCFQKIESDGRLARRFGRWAKKKN